MGWRNAFEGDYSLVDCLLFMAFDGIAYLLLAAYLETVAPAQHGSPRHPLFFVQPLWRAAERGVKWLFGGGLGCFHASALPPPPEGSATMVDDEYSEANDFGNDNSGVRKIESAISATQLDRQQHDVSFDVSVSGSGSGSSNRIARRSQNNNNKDEEPMPLIMGAPAVTITNLVKDYHSSSSSLSSRKEKKRPAVDGLSLELWAGQVTCLLGHNGAGQSIINTKCMRFKWAVYFELSFSLISSEHPPSLSFLPLAHTHPPPLFHRQVDHRLNAHGPHPSHLR